MLRSILLVLVAGTLAACATSLPPHATAAPLATSSPVPTTPLDYQTFIQQLRARGATVSAAGSVNQPFFAVAGQVVQVNGQRVEVHEYASAGDRQVDAARVAPDGYTIGSTRVDWIAPPHFFQSGCILVLYLGSNAPLLRTLTSLLGPQFAGQ